MQWNAFYSLGVFEQSPPEQTGTLPESYIAKKQLNAAGLGSGFYLAQKPFDFLWGAEPTSTYSMAFRLAFLIA